MAWFLQSGRLAYWRCIRCGVADRPIDPLPERLAEVSGWIEKPPRLTARGPAPPANGRRWATPDGLSLVEGDPCSTDFAGVPIPDLETAHSYKLYDGKGDVVAVFEPGRETLFQYSDHYALIRYQVVGEALLRFESLCYEDSTYEVPHAGMPTATVVLSGLCRLAT